MQHVRKYGLVKNQLKQFRIQVLQLRYVVSETESTKHGKFRNNFAKQKKAPLHPQATALDH